MTRAIVVAMPITLVLLGADGARRSFPELTWAEAFLLAAVLTPTDPVVTSAVVTAQRVPSIVRHTLNLESGLNDGLALPFVLFFLVLAAAGRRRRQRGARSSLGEAAFGAAGRRRARASLGGRLHHHLPGGGITARYEGIYAIGFGLAAFGLADVTFGNGLIAAFVAGIAMGVAEHEITGRLRRVRRERQRDLPGDHLLRLRRADRRHRLRRGDLAPGRSSSLLALLVARPVAILLAFVRSRLPGPQKLFIAWFGPKGVASMLFALFVLKSDVGASTTIFDVAAFVILSSIVAHGLTDTVGATWIERRMGRRLADR